MRKILLTAFVCAIALAGSPLQAQSLKPAEKATLQAAMYQHIDNLLVDGAYLQLVAASGEVRRLAPTRAHPMIMRMGEHFVLCSEFRDAAGKDVNMDFYLTRSGNQWLVFHTEIDNRAPLEKLVEAGKVKIVE